MGLVYKDPQVYVELACDRVQEFLSAIDGLLLSLGWTKTNFPTSAVWTMPNSMLSDDSINIHHRLYDCGTSTFSDTVGTAFKRYIFKETASVPPPVDPDVVEVIVGVPPPWIPVQYMTQLVNAINSTSSLVTAVISDPSNKITVTRTATPLAVVWSQSNPATVGRLRGATMYKSVKTSQGMQYRLLVSDPGRNGLGFYGPGDFGYGNGAVDFQPYAVDDDTIFMDIGARIVTLCGKQVKVIANPHQLWPFVLGNDSVSQRGNAFQTGTLYINPPTSPKPIADISNAVNAVVTQPAHGYLTAQQVYLVGGNMPSVRGLSTITKIDDNRYSLDKNSTSDPIYDGSAIVGNINLGETAQAFYMIADGIEGTTSSVNLRNRLHGTGANAFFCWNQNYFRQTGIASPFGAGRIYLPTSAIVRASGDHDRALFSNEDGTLSEPLLGWGLTGEAAMAKIVGQFFGAQAYSDTLTMDLTSPTIPMYDGRNWLNYTHNNTGTSVGINGLAGGILLTVP